MVPVALDVPLPKPATELPTAPAHPDRLLELAGGWNLAGSARRLVDALAQRA